jgi:glutamate---cysteine ligase / carboxylate-amine ligase
VRQRHREHLRGSRREPTAATVELDQELFRHQVEIRTEPVRDLGELEGQLVEARRSAGEATHSAGLALIACATVPIEGAQPQVSHNDRYLAMVETYGDVARFGTTCGMHVHVAVDSPEEGVGCLDRLAPWLPVLVAMSSNSPYEHGRDTRYASWRSQLWTRWPSAGPTQAFGSLEGYRRVSGLLMTAGAALDTGMLYFGARLSVRYPTVEVRVLDVCTDVADTVLLAALARGLVETAAEQWSEGEPLPDWRAEELRAATWRAARMGVSNTLLHPVGRDLRPVREVLADLVEQVRPRLEAAGDLERVQDGIERVLRGSGATHQRAAFERTGSLEAVVDDLVERTEYSWASRPPG